MSFVYGPVPSRRLGQSLGIDPIPSKTCNYNCVYCQLGRTRLLTNERKDFFPPECILAEVESSLTAHKSGDIDCVTFVGQGEPLLCHSLGVLIRRVKAVSDLPVAVITNGSLLWQPEVQQELQAADIVMPSLDCVDESTFRTQFRGRLWVEVMLLQGVNDGEPALFRLRDALAFLRPDQVHLNVPIRPPAESWVEPPDEEGLMRAVAILGEAATVVAPYEGSFDLSRNLPLGEAILEVIQRHPMRQEEVLRTLSDLPSSVVETALAELEAEGRARRVEFRGHVFWRHTTVPPADNPDDTEGQSRRGRAMSS